MSDQLLTGASPYDTESQKGSAKKPNMQAVIAAESIKTDSSPIVGDQSQYSQTASDKAESMQPIGAAIKSDNYPQSMAQALAEYVSNSPDPVKAAKDMQTAYAIKDALATRGDDVKISDILENIDSYRSIWEGVRKPNQMETGEALLNNLKGDAYSLGAAIGSAALAMPGAKLAAGDGEGGDALKTAEEQYRQWRKKAAALKFDPEAEDRSLITKFLKVGTDISVVMAPSAFIALKSRGSGAKIAAAGVAEEAAVAAPEFAQAVGIRTMQQYMTARAITMGPSLAWDTAYATGATRGEMIDSGVPPEVADRYCLGAGLLQAAAGNMLGSGIKKGIELAVNPESETFLSKAILTRVTNSGVFQKLAKIQSGNEAVKAASETAMKSSGVYAHMVVTQVPVAVLQSSVDQTAVYLSQAYVDSHGGKIDPDKKTTLDSAMKVVADNVVGQVVGAGVLGIGVASLHSVNVAAMKVKTKTGEVLQGAAAMQENCNDLKSAAESMDRETFHKFCKTHPMFEGVDETQVTKTADEIFEVASASKVKTAERMAQTPSSHGVDRDSHGALISHATMTEEDISGSTMRYSFHSKAGEKTYGTVDVKASSDGIKIVDGEFGGDEAMAREAVGSVIAQFPGKPVTIDANLHPDIEKAYSYMAENNPRGKEFGAQWHSPIDDSVDSTHRQRIRSQLADAGYKPGESETIISLMDRAAKRKGGSFAEAYKDLNLRADDGTLEKAGKVGAYGDDPVSDGKKLIMLAQKSNGATVAHELFHYFMDTEGETQWKKEMGNLYGVKDGAWEKDHYERASNDFLRYIEKGSAPDGVSKGLFARAASWVKEFWSRSLSKVALDPRVEEAFNKWFNGEGLNKAIREEKIRDTDRQPVEKHSGSSLALKLSIKEPPDFKPDREASAVPIAGLSNLETWTPNRGNQPSEYGKNAKPVHIWERTDGSRVVIDGRNRVKNAALAGKSDIPAYTYKEKNGFTEDDARWLSSKEDMRAGRGDIHERAQIFRESKLSRGALLHEGLLGEDRSRIGYVLGKMVSEDLRGLARDGAIDPRTAAVIGEGAGGDKGLEDAAIQYANTGASAHEVNQFIKIKTLPEDHPVRAELKTEADEAAFIKTTAAFAESETNRVRKTTFDHQLNSLANESYRRVVDGEWRSDPQLQAKMLRDSGIELSPVMKEYCDSVLELEKMAELGEHEPFLFMGEDELRRAADTDANTSSYEASCYNTLDEYLEAIGQKDASGADLEFFKDRFDWAHMGEKEVQYKKGKFAASMTQDRIEGLFDTIEHLTDYPGSDPEQRTRARKALYGNPVLKRIYDKYVASKTFDADVLSKEDVRDAQTYIKQNEALVKHLFGEVAGDKKLVQESLDDMGRLTPFEAKDISSSSLSLSEQVRLKRDLDGNAIKQELSDGTISISSLNEYAATKKNAESDMRIKAEGGLRDSKERSKWNAEMLKMEKDKTARRKLQAYMAKMTKDIFRKPSSNVSVTATRAIQLLQSMIRNPSEMTREKAKLLSSSVFTENPGLADAVADMVNKYEGRGIDEWSMKDLREMRDVVRSMEKRGREYEAGRKLAQRMGVSLAQGAIRDQNDKRGAAEPGYGGSLEEKEVLRSIKKAIKGYELSTVRPELFATHFLDKGIAGVHTKELFDKVVDCEREKQTRIAERTNKITDYIHNTKLEANGKKTSVEKWLRNQFIAEGVRGADMEDMTFDGDRLLGARLMVGTKDSFNEQQRQAFINGALYSTKERAEIAEADMLSSYDERVDGMLKTLEQLPHEIETLAQMMLDEFGNAEAQHRFAQTLMSVSGKDIKFQKFYFPIRRVAQHGVDAVMEAFSMGDPSAMQKGIDSGFIYDRVNMSPKSQTDICYSATRLFTDGISHQEHLSAYGGQVKRLRGIYSAPDIMASIKAELGDAGPKYLNQYLAELTSPGDYRTKDLSEGPFGFLRGGVVMSALAYRISSFALQMGTSGLPFLAEVAPHELAAEYARSIAHSGHYYKSTEAKSALLLSRQFDPVKEMQLWDAHGIARGVKKFGEIGMMPLNFADRYSVAVGWNAIVKKQTPIMLEKVQAEYMATKKEGQPDTMPADMAYAEAERRSMDYADKAVLRLQPHASDLFRSPMYQNMTAAKRAVLQFTQPMNVIYQNMVYDTRVMAKSGRILGAVGLLAGISGAGLVQGAVQVLRGQGPKDKDDDDAWKRYVAYCLVSQQVSSTPWVGDMADRTLRSIVMGEKGTQQIGNRMFPAATEFASAIQSAFTATSGSAKEGTAAEAVSSVMEDAGLDGDVAAKAGGFLTHGVNSALMCVGLPVSAAKEYANLVKMASDE